MLNKKQQRGGNATPLHYLLLSCFTLPYIVPSDIMST